MAATPRSGPGGHILNASGGGSGCIPGPSPARSDAAQTLASLLGTLKRSHDDTQDDRPDRGTRMGLGVHGSHITKLSASSLCCITA